MITTDNYETNDDADSRRLAETVDGLMVAITIMRQLGNLAAEKAEPQQESILEGDIWDDIDEEPCILLPGNTVIKNPELLTRLTNEVL